MNQTFTYTVPDVSCGHCRAAITDEVGAVEGVETVDVDLDAKAVTVSGKHLDHATLVAAIDAAGYQATQSH